MSRVVDFQDVSVFINDQELISDINFDINANEFVFLTGKIGSGKTSFLKTIYADLQLNSGTANVLNFDLNNLKKKDVPFLRRQIGFIFQDFKFLNDRNVYRNFEFVLEATGWQDKDEISARIKEVIEDVGMSAKILSKPFELSGGELQRLSLARAILNNPKLILADEPTGNLDEESTIYVTKKIAEQVVNGSSAIFVTHNPTTLDLVPGAKRLKIEDKKFISY
ncbi:MAG: ATP-binding cassette domain-containing protein [Bacteroidales bacterium]|nr:ATP-binding cassette domain-containing protein [Bacteroidales bacterium]